jgi:hypothetical protein
VVDAFANHLCGCPVLLRKASIDLNHRETERCGPPPQCGSGFNGGVACALPAFRARLPDTVATRDNASMLQVATSLAGRAGLIWNSTARGRRAASSCISHVWLMSNGGDHPCSVSNYRTAGDRRNRRAGCMADAADGGGTGVDTGNCARPRRRWALLPALII